MSKNETILTIAIPTWNRAQLLEELIIQLTKQITDYALESKIELLISNNGSVDETETICLRYSSLFPFMTYHNNGENIGARNNVLKSMELANGKYIIFIGDDDRLRLDCLSTLINFLQENFSVGIFIDSSRDKLNSIKNEFISLQQLLNNYYWYMGNAGLFIVKSSYVNNVLQSHPYEYFNICWPQTQLMILGAHMHPEDKILAKDLNLVGSDIHQDVMIYSSFYLWNAGYFALLQAALEIRDEIGNTLYSAARKHLKSNIKQWVINIAQCGIYIDERSIRLKTVKSILNAFHYFSLKEKTAFLTVQTWLD